MNAPKPMRRGYVVELQPGDGGPVQRRTTAVASTALDSYLKFMAYRGPKQVVVLLDEREITGSQLRVLAEQKANR